MQDKEEQEESGGGKLTPAKKWAHPVTSKAGMDALKKIEVLLYLPEVFVFDLDDTLWEGDLDTTTGPPFCLKEDGLIEAKNGDSVCLFKEVMEIFDWLDSCCYKAAIASHTTTPHWAEGVLKSLQTSRGAKYTSVASVLEMHGAQKSVHMKRIAHRCRVNTQDMVFLDNMDYNIQDGRSAGVVSCHTPDGLCWKKMTECLVEFDKSRKA